MALQFTPPPDWLIQDYLTRKAPAQQASEAVNQALQTYAASKDSQQKEALAQQQKDIEMAKGLASNGQDFTDAYKQVVGARTAPQPVGTSLIDRAKAFFTGSNTGKSPNASTPDGAGLPPATQATPTMGALQNQAALAPQMATPSPDSFQPPAPSTGTAQAPLQTDPLMQEYLKDPAAYKRQHGEAGITKLKTQGELDKLLTDRSKGPLQTLTKEQALENGTYDPSKQYIVEPPAPKDEGHAKLIDKQLADSQKAYNSDKNREKAEAVIDRASQAAPLLKSGAIDNASAKQAVQTALTYMATGGMRVNEVELRQFGGAQTVSNKLGQWYKGLDAGTFTPRDAQDLGKVLDVFQQSAEQNLKNIGLRHTHQYLQRSRSGESESDAYYRVTGNEFAPQESHSPGDAQRPTITSQKDYEALPQGARYQDANGVPHVKR